MARPTLYTPELADIICKAVATHPFGLPTICKIIEGLPEPETIRVWRWEKPEFSLKYAEAKRFQAELMAESIEDVAEELLKCAYTDEATGASKLDAGMVGYARLVIDSRKWQASKLAPKIYGDKQQTEVTASATSVEEIAKRVTEINSKSEKDY